METNKATIEFRTKENGMHQIKLSKKSNSTYGCKGENKFFSKEGNIFISELKCNPIIKKPRKFVISIRNIGTGENEGECRLQQLNLDEEELLQLKKSIDVLLNSNKQSDNK